MVLPSILAALSVKVMGILAPPLQRRWQPLVAQAWFKTLSRVFSIRIRVVGEPVSPPVLVASNHHSWLDIIVLGAATQMAFISKAEIRRWPLVGMLAAYGGRTLFINRGELRSFNSLEQLLSYRLQGSERIVFFPEGTTSYPGQILRFKPRLFHIAGKLQCPVQPVALTYVDGDGAGLAPMVGAQTFAGHLLNFLKTKQTVVVVHFLPAVDPGKPNGRELAERIRSEVIEGLAEPWHYA